MIDQAIQDLGRLSEQGILGISNFEMMTEKITLYLKIL